MRDNSVHGQRAGTDRVHGLFGIVAVCSLISAFVQTALGGVVRATGSGLGCPDWPLCHGQIVPPFELTTLIEYSHRLSASVLILLLLAASVLAWAHYRSNRLILVPTLLGMALVVGAAVLGGVAVLTELDWWVVLVHLSIAEGVVACTAVLSLVVWRMRRETQHADGALEGSRGFKRLALIGAVGVFLVILSGSYMVGQGAGSSCATWPLCRGSLMPEGTPYAVHMGHRFLTALVGVLIVWAAAWSRRRAQPDVSMAGLALLILFAVQVALGAGTVMMGFTAEMKAIHLTASTLVWIAAVSLAALVYLPGPERSGGSALSNPGRLAT